MTDFARATSFVEYQRALVTSYLEHLFIERRVGQRTVGRHDHDLRALVTWASHKSLDLLDRDDLDLFLNSRPRARSTLRSFYRFMVLERQIEQSPMDKDWPS
jgi:site-specific recombinase XerD